MMQDILPICLEMVWCMMCIFFLDMNRLVTRSWLRPCLAGCLRRLVFSGLGLLPIIQLERALPLLPTPSLTLWWVMAYIIYICIIVNLMVYTWFVTIVKNVWVILFLLTTLCLDCPYRNSALWLRCCLVESGCLLMEMTFSWNLSELIHLLEPTSRKRVCFYYIRFN